MSRASRAALGERGRLGVRRARLAQLLDERLGLGRGRSRSWRISRMTRNHGTTENSSPMIVRRRRRRAISAIDDDLAAERRARDDRGRAAAAAASPAIDDDDSRRRRSRRRRAAARSSATPRRRRPATSAGEPPRVGQSRAAAARRTTPADERHERERAPASPSPVQAGRRVGRDDDRRARRSRDHAQRDRAARRAGGECGGELAASHATR